MGFQVPVEDPAGDCHDLAVYNYPTIDCGSYEDLDALLPVGTVLVIREPTLKKATQGPFPMVRVDSPSDLLLIRDGHAALENVRWKTGTRVRGMPPPPKTVNEWRIAGNSHFKAGRWLPAAAAYTAGLLVDADESVLKLNRSEAYLRLSYFAAALRDAEDVLRCIDPTDPSYQKALLRAAKALHGLGNYEGASGKLLELQQANPAGKEVTLWLNRIRARLLERKEGTYDWCRLFLESKTDPRVDACDYVGPVVVTTMKERGGGRGVKATSLIRAGELLVRTIINGVIHAQIVDYIQLC